MKTCPCGSGASYDECCGKYHRGLLPEMALQLMKARYSAYAIGDVGFIMSTTHPKHVESKKDPRVRQKEIEHFSKNTVFQKLEILKVEPGDPISYVTFRVFLEQGGKPFSYTERSTFEKVQGKWFYLLGDLQGEFHQT